jgi:hypothetical protein
LPAAFCNRNLLSEFTKCAADSLLTYVFFLIFATSCYFNFFSFLEYNIDFPWAFSV